MHARVDQLLSLRDGEPVAAEAKLHLEQCALCAARAASLVRLRRDLQALPQFDAGSDALQAIIARAKQPPLRQLSRGVYVAAAAVAAITLTALLIHEAGTPQIAATHPPSDTMTVAAIDPAQLEQLVARSRELDQLLQYLPRPSVQRVAMAATLDGIEDRIQWLDWQISSAPSAGLTDEQSGRLWRERVELMDSLVTVRYAELAPLSF